MTVTCFKVAPSICFNVTRKETCRFRTMMARRWTEFQTHDLLETMGLYHPLIGEIKSS
jgi:hypothetical protein